MVHSFARHAFHGAAGALRRALSWPARVGAARRTMSQLARMSEYELRDIGLSPAGCRRRDRAAARRRPVRPCWCGAAPPASGLRAAARISPPEDRAIGPSTSAAKRSTEGRRDRRARRRSSMTAHSAAAGVQVHAKPGARQDGNPERATRWPSSPTCTAASTRAGWSCWRAGWSGRSGSTPASCPISCPRRSRSATATGRSRRSRPTCSTAASRSPARSTAR